VLSESDPAWAAAVAEDRSPDLRRFDPRYFFVNGRSFPDTMDHPDTHLVGHLGERVLVRLVNAGYGWRSMHMHGFHFEVVASDGRPLPQPYLKDTLSIGPGERYDLLVTLDQLGSYPFHSHVLLDNMNDGTYPGGIHTMVTVRPPGAPLEHAGHDGAVAAPPAGPSAGVDPGGPGGARPRRARLARRRFPIRRPRSTPRRTTRTRRRPPSPRAAPRSWRCGATASTPSTSSSRSAPPSPG
jgi:hypothetical protein